MRRGHERVGRRAWRAVVLPAALALCLTPAWAGEVSLDCGPLDVPLTLLKLTTKDLRVKSSYAEDLVGEGNLRLSLVTDGLRSAVGSAAAAHALGCALTESPDLSHCFETLAPLLDVGSVRVPPPGPLHSTAPLAVALAAPGKRQDLDPNAPAPEGEPKLPPEVREATAALVYGVARANELLGRVTRDLPPEKAALIREGLPKVLSLLSERQSVDQAMVVQSLRAAAQLDLREMIAAATTVVGAVAEARARLAQLPPDSDFRKPGAAASAVLFSQKTDFGEVVIAGPGPDVHDTPAAIIIDLGGDDRYEMAGPREGAPPVQVIIDLGGNDTYVGETAFGPAAAMLGVSVIVDESGDDVYLSRGPFSLGAATFGVGLLVDARGDDRYLGDCFSQGAAVFGLGLLLDGGGDDVFDARLCSQGFGCVKGVGALVSLGGHDRYTAGDGSADAASAAPRALSLSQGFGWGLRDLAPGGIGILAGGGGADTYTAGNLAQGAGYWYGEGILYDRGGDDTYLGGDTCQGAGAFLSLGHLLDDAGDDRYLAHDVAQGAAHDLAIGILRDAAGNDTYIAGRMAQGTGGRGAIGLAADLSGDDSYRAAGECRGRALGERSAGGTGLFVDGGGVDDCGEVGGGGRLWVTGGLGAGVDMGEGSVAALKADLPLTSGRLTFPIRLPVAFAPILPLEAGTGSEPGIEQLWTQATSAADPQERGQAVRALVRLGEKAVPSVVAKLGSADPEAARNAQALLVAIGSPAVPELLRIVEDGSAREAPIAMRLLGQIADPRAAVPLVQQAKAPQWRRRAAAAASMGALRGDDTELALEELLRDPDEDVRRTAVIALGIRGAPDAAVPISEMMGDPVPSVRFAAAEALVKLGVQCPPHVFSLVGCEQPEVRHLSIETFGRLGSKDSLDILLGLLQSPDWGDRAFAAEAIGRIGDSEACRKLQAALAQEKNGLVLAKARAAMNLGRPQTAFGEG